ncbi:hypothetical protein RH831_00670 [Halodesulfurarchaeum sp. HSR-GB]|uniref:hypothetical protein n=1 Tax=Halodesulfurarchaeum sp. HSR-GB TaxID=3074077 RepID=UPI002862388F|nr:hypothetical protein [Halodesulfurarchaeum sp. HSR-GB]MDR5655696.1 hypothetical protein [Halodesulfurarchaeum sp. HSR-GB]
MSSPSHTHDPTGASPPGHGPLLRPLEAVGFWAAVALPFIYVPLILRGLDTSSMQLTVAVLIAVHLLALIAGHRYNAD